VRAEPMRLPGLNALRAAGMFGVVVLHAGVPYTVAPMPGLAWPVGHHRTSPWIDGLFWAIEGSIMPLFFTISGYCAAQGLAKLGPRAYVGRRIRRILFPFVAAAIILLPLEFYIWLLGWVVEGRLPLHKLRSLKLGPLYRDLWGFSHLWYLEYLILLSLGYAAWRAWRSRLEQAKLRLRSRRSFKAAVASPPTLAAQRVPLHTRATGEKGIPRQRLERVRQPWLAASVVRLWQGNLSLAFLATATASTAVLWWSPETVAGFQHGFLPFPAKFAFSAVFFLYGIGLDGRRPSAWIWGEVWAGASLALFALVWPAIHVQVTAGLSGWPRLGFGLAAGLFSTAAVTACWMLFVGRKSLDTPAAAYLAGASFWVYLVHHPLMGLCQIAFSLTSWPAELQFLADLAITLIVTLASYEVLVRKTWLGIFLEGWQKKASSAAPTEAAGETGSPPLGGEVTPKAA